MDRKRPASGPSSEPKRKKPFAVPHPLRTEHVQSKRVASLAIGADGFTLFDGHSSVVYDGSLDHSKLAKEIRERHARLIHVADERTWKKMSDLKLSYPHLLPIVLKRVELRYTDKTCAYCGSERCHRWLAVACLSEAFEFYFDHVQHE